MVGKTGHASCREASHEKLIFRRQAAQHMNTGRNLVETFGVMIYRTLQARGKLLLSNAANAAHFGPSDTLRRQYSAMSPEAPGHTRWNNQAEMEDIQVRARRRVSDDYLDRGNLCVFSVPSKRLRFDLSCTKLLVNLFANSFVLFRQG